VRAPHVSTLLHHAEPVTPSVPTSVQPGAPPAAPHADLETARATRDIYTLLLFKGLDLVQEAFAEESDGIVAQLPLHLFDSEDFEPAFVKVWNTRDLFSIPCSVMIGVDRRASRTRHCFRWLP
jgi:hypothetical protein